VHFRHHLPSQPVVTDAHAEPVVVQPGDCGRVAEPYPSGAVVAAALARGAVAQRDFDPAGGGQFDPAGGSQPGQH